MGVPASDQTPRLVDDDTLVNVGSEVLQIASTVPTGILGTKLLAGKILMHSPRAVKYVSSILTAGIAVAAIKRSKNLRKLTRNCQYNFPL